MAEQKQPTAWITRGGKHIPIYSDSIAKDQADKEKQIKQAEKEAAAQKQKAKYEDDEHHPSSVKAVKKGDFFKLSNKPNAKVYIRGDYDKSDKTFECQNAEDMNEYRYFKGSKTVYVGFTY